MAHKDLVYFAPHFDLETGAPGVREKILCQAKVFTKGGWRVYPIGWCGFAPAHLRGSFPRKLYRFAADLFHSIVDDRSCYQQALEQIQTIQPAVVFIR
ncbi:MAG: hypothetical protein K0B14_16335, partial [Anaerolineaceae bacterium]|nr:hypothetical protein [Anaerolineaceae bacterium]